FIAEKEKAVIGHLGEPRNCWLPLEQMTVRSDSSYFAEHPQYHMALHPDYPSYEEQIAARDHMLEKHPHLTFIGAHLGSLEWDVDELAKRLDQYPHFAVDMAARICHFQVQDREKVRKFIIAYADRLLYGTDLSASDDADNLGWIDATWRKDWQYFSTDDLMQADQVRQPFRGLDLPKEVLKKIYHDNAVAWLKIGQ
ncbi:MAG: amidohydrolase, partial [Calditrichaeota bacterium]